MKKPKEGALRAVRKYFKAEGIYKGKRWIVRMGTPGVPDIVALRLIECKLPTKRPNDDERWFREAAHVLGLVEESKLLADFSWRRCPEPPVRPKPARKAVHR